MLKRETPWRRLLGTPVLDASGTTELGRVCDAACDLQHHLVRALVLIQRPDDQEAARLVLCAADHLAGWEGGALRSSVTAPTSTREWQMLGNALGAVQRGSGLWWPRRCLGLQLQDETILLGRIHDLRFASWPLRCSALQVGEPGLSQRIALDRGIATQGDLVCIRGAQRRPGTG